MPNDLIIPAGALMLFWLLAFSALGYWLNKKIDGVRQAINHIEQTNRSVPSNVDHQTARRQAAMRMFYGLMIGVAILVAVLIISIGFLPADNDFVGGIILTAIAGAIGAFLSLIGIIVKGIMDNLTREEQPE